jgi:MFS family permease
LLEDFFSLSRRLSIRKFQHAYRALKHPNYRLFFFGQGISLIGTWMQRIAVIWLVYRLTGSAFLLGFVGFSTQIPNFLLAPFGGVIADRHDRYRILLVTQVLSLVQASVLAALVLTHTIRVWEIFVLALVLGLINALDNPVRQSFVVEMVEGKESLGNAIALNSTMVNLARLVGPSLAGIFIASWGEGVCFLLNALSFIAVIGSLLAMKITSKPTKESHPRIFSQLKEGFSYAFGFSPIRNILLLLALVSLMGMPYQVLMPIFAKQVFGGDSRTLGFLMTMVGVGAFGGGLYLANRKNVSGLVDILPWAAGTFGMGLILFSLSRNMGLSMAILVFSGFSMMINMAASNSILQNLVEEDKRGRLMSLHTVSFLGMVPFGNLLAGILAQNWGAAHTLFFGGTCCVAGALAFMRQLPEIREEIFPVYEKNEIRNELLKEAVSP